MNREELFALHQATCADALDLMSRKNRDYGENEDPFRNFRRWGLLGILVRMGDKLARLETFVQTGTLSVVEESASDCVSDLINYSILFKGYMQDGHTTGHIRGNGKVSTAARTTKQGPRQDRTGAGKGNTRSHSGSQQRGKRSAARGTADSTFRKFESRTHTSHSSGLAVGNKSRRGKVKG